MDPIMWDFQIAQTGGSLSNFQMEVLGNLYGGRTHVRREDPLFDRASRHTAPRRFGTPRPMRQWRSLAMRSALAMLPLVISLYAAM